MCPVIGWLYHWTWSAICPLAASICPQFCSVIGHMNNRVMRTSPSHLSPALIRKSGRLIRHFRFGVCKEWSLSEVFVAGPLMNASHQSSYTPANCIILRNCITSGGRGGGGGECKQFARFATKTIRRKPSTRISSTYQMWTMSDARFRSSLTAMQGKLRSTANAHAFGDQVETWKMLSHPLRWLADSLDRSCLARSKPKLHAWSGLCGHLVACVDFYVP